jgi:hypothetical protein
MGTSLRCFRNRRIDCEYAARGFLGPSVSPAPSPRPTLASQPYSLFSSGLSGDHGQGAMGEGQVRGVLREEGRAVLLVPKGEDAEGGEVRLRALSATGGIQLRASSS